jgi:hypothetical protein
VAKTGEGNKEKTANNLFQRKVTYPFVHKANPTSHAGSYN